jgi:pimeloyl-ACP methyl ester carboxylesterase
MSASRPGLTPLRLIALVLIGAIAAALVGLSAASAPDVLAVPPGATAGDLALRPCTYQTEDGGHAADCGTLMVPEDRADPNSPLIALPVVRLRAQGEQPGEPLFYLEGGPGITNVVFAQAGRYTADRDVVLVGYRGVDGSVRLDCPEAVDAHRHSTDFLSDESFRAYRDALAACADRLTADGVDLSQYGLPQQVQDLEAARAALGYDRIDLLSQSAGTRTAMIYAWSHPDRIHRSVMIGVNPPGHYVWSKEIADEQIDRYAGYCARDGDCARRTGDLAATMRRTATDMPDRWLFLPINDSSVRVFSFYGLMESTAEAPMSAPMTLDAWLAAAEGDPSGFWAHTLVADILPIPFVWGQYASAGRVDAAAARDYFATVQPDPSNLGWVGSAFAWGGGRMVDAWPAVTDEDAYPAVLPSQVQTLLIGGELDFSTPPQNATRELLPSLPNGQEVVIPGLGHTASFFAEQPDAGTHLINTFLASGQVDDSRYHPQVVDFTPAQSLPALARATLATMLTLGLLTVLILVVIWYRVRRNGRLGRPASLVTRIASPLVLGPGGWSLALLVVMVGLPGYPLDGQLLAAASVSVPIGLATFGAWVHLAWPARRRTIGLVAALATALVGAWLGFLVVPWPVSVATAIVGAALGANLALVVLDVWARQPAGGPNPTHSAARAAVAGRPPAETRAPAA